MVSRQSIKGDVDMDAVKDEVAELKAKLAKCREALEYYGTNSTDGGGRAQWALGETKEVS